MSQKIIKNDVIAAADGSAKHICICADDQYAVFAPVVFHRNGGRKIHFKDLFVYPPLDDEIGVFKLMGHCDKSGNLVKY